MTVKIVPTLSPVAEDVARLARERDARLHAAAVLTRRTLGSVATTERNAVASVVVALNSVGVEVVAALESGDVKSVFGFAKYVAGYTTATAWAERADKSVTTVPFQTSIDRAYRVAVALRDRDVKLTIAEYLAVADAPTAQGFLKWATTGVIAETVKVDAADEGEGDGTDGEQVDAPFSPTAIADKLLKSYTVAQCEQIQAALSSALKSAKKLAVAA